MLPALQTKKAEVRQRIYYVWNYLEWGGAQMHLISIMKRARKNWDITVLLPEGSSEVLLSFLRSAGADIVFLKHKLDLSAADSVSRKIRRQFSRVRSEFEILSFFFKRTYAPFVVHIETAPWQSWQLLAALRLLGGRVFVTCHNALSGGPAWRKLVWRSRLAFLIKSGSLRLFAANRDTLNRLAEWVPKNGLSRIPVTHTAVDPIEISTAAIGNDERKSLREKFGIGETDLVVLCVGQFIDRKGRWIFFEAAREILSQGNKMTFVWLGPEPPTPAEQEMIDSYGLGDSFRFVVSNTLGAQRQDVLKFFNIADIFALPSYLEGLPISLLEAMSLGLPSISTNVNSIPEAIIQGKTGILVEPGDYEALAGSLLELAENAELRKTLGNNGREHVLRQFDEEKVAQIVLASYESSIP
jgi:glycosyltransferase involved in cell wall biosynthesis